MISRLASLALVIAAACHRTPDMASCRLVGTWEIEADLSESVIARIKSQGDDPEVLAAKFKAAFVPDGHPQFDTFAADGRWIHKSWVGDGYLEHDSRWTLLADRGDRVEIEVYTSSTPDLRIPRTLVFETPGVIREGTGALAGLRYIRAPAAK